MKATFKGSYDVGKNTGAAATLAVKAGGDVKLKVSVTEATFVNGPSLNGLTLGIEKPDSFIVDYKVLERDLRFKFMNTVAIWEKPLKFSYKHSRGNNTTLLKGTFELDPANKVSVNYALDSKLCKLKYTYVHEELTTFEPTYDMAKNTWDFAVSRRCNGDHTLKASYHTSSNVLGLQWAWDCKHIGCFKIAASVKLVEKLKTPTLSAETTWTFEM